MAKTKIAEEEAAAVARGWRQSGQTQESYARAKGIGQRTLRGYIERFCPQPSPAAVRRVITAAITDLQNMLSALDEAPGAMAPGRVADVEVDAARRPAATASTAPPMPAVVNVVGNQTAARHADEQPPRQAEHQTLKKEPAPEVKLRRRNFFGFLLDENGKPLPESKRKSTVSVVAAEK